MRTINSVLAGIANKELKGNVFAWVIARYYDVLDKTKKDSFYESLAVKFVNHQNDENLPVLDERKLEIDLDKYPKDLRIKSVILHNVRGIPDKIDGIPFGVNFYENEKIFNALILGPNSSGKSSLFSGMEYVFAKRIGEADLRTENIYPSGDSYYLDYLKHFSAQPICKILTNSGEFDLSNNPFKDKSILQLINPNNYFISDYDIYKNGKINYLGKSNDEASFHYLIASSLGLQEFLDFQNLIFNLSKYRRSKESGQLSKLIKEKKENDLQIYNWKVEISKRQEQIKEISEAEKKQNSSKIELTQKHNIEVSHELLQKDFNIIFSLDSLESNVNKFRGLSMEFNSFPIEKATEVEAQFLSLGLTLLKDSSHSDCPLCQNSKIDIDAIRANVNKRVSLYEDYRKAISELNSTYDTVITDLRELSVLISSTKRKLEEEKSLIQNNANFLKLHSQIADLLNSFESEAFHFFFEYDFTGIFSVSNSHRFVKILTERLNFSEVGKLLKQINEFATLHKKEVDEVISNIKLGESATLPQEKIAILKNEIAKFEESISSSQRRNESIDKEIPGLEKSVKLVTVIKEQAAQFEKIISLKISELLNEVFEPIQTTICEILENYLDDDNISIKVITETAYSDDGEILSETMQVKLIRKVGKNEEFISPNRYFNTFRYRLFSLMVSCSIAIATRRLTGINLPFVIDDLFYASDYVNRSSIVEFLQKLISIIDKYSQEDMEMQLILFTHDEMVFDSAVEAIEDVEEKITVNNGHPRENTKHLRMFKTSERDEVPTIKDDLKYWNIATEIPANIKSFYELINQ